MFNDSTNPTRLEFKVHALVKGDWAFWFKFRVAVEVGELVMPSFPPKADEPAIMSVLETTALFLQNAADSSREMLSTILSPAEHLSFEGR